MCAPVASEPDSSSIGFYGKLPAKGDFLTRNLPRDFVSRWDDWLQEGMNASRASLGDDWLNVYLTSPIWRFALAPGVCGDSGWFGLMLPSMDRVGRYFPFTVARALPRGQSPLAASGAQCEFLRRIEALALAALDADALDLEDLVESLMAAEAGVDSDVSDEVGLPQEIDIESGVRVPIGVTLDTGRAVCGIAGNWLQERIGAHGVWWTEGSEIVVPSLLIAAGLPRADGFSALLTGGWAEHGWSDIVAAAAPCPDEIEHTGS